MVNPYGPYVLAIHMIHKDWQVFKKRHGEGERKHRTRGMGTKTKKQGHGRTNNHKGAQPMQTKTQYNTQ